MPIPSKVLLSSKIVSPLNRAVAWIQNEWISSEETGNQLGGSVGLLLLRRWSLGKGYSIVRLWIQSRDVTLDVGHFGGRKNLLHNFGVNCGKICRLNENNEHYWIDFQVGDS